MSVWRFRRLPAQRLPLDPRSARQARRYLRLTPWSSLATLVTVLSYLAFFIIRPTDPVALVAFVAISAGNLALTLPSVGGRLPAQTPSRNSHGDLRITELPIAVAQLWQALNPGVTSTDQPAARPHSRRFYVAWSASLLLAAIALFVVLANDDREDFILLWLAAPALFVAGCAVALKLLPPDYLRFERSDD